MKSLCTKQPLNKDIMAKMLFPKGGRYRGVPLYVLFYTIAIAFLLFLSVIVSEVKRFVVQAIYKSSKNSP